MRSFVAISLIAADAAYAFPWVRDVPGVDSSMLPSRYQKRQQPPAPGGPGSAETCPFNPNHVNAVGIQPGQYNNARNGRKGNERGGYQVPAPGDTAHRFIAPTNRDIRGPCPGLNVAANHGFLARDGITTYNELVDAQQNVYNVGYDLANLLAFLGLQADGDLVTTKLSISCDATTRTSFNPALTGSQPGLAGHNKFEGDTSLTRNDFFTGGGDNFSFNRTLYNMMSATTGGLHNLQNLAQYRLERYDQSLAENPNFYYGPLSLLLYGAASFLYELFPSGPAYIPDQATMDSFFVEERLPANWINRVEPYSNGDVGREIVAMYLLRPVAFGGNVGDGTFAPLNWRGIIVNGTIGNDIQPAAASCLLYQLATQSVPSTLNGIVTPTVEAMSFFLTRVAPEFANLGCPRPLT